MARRSRTLDERIREAIVYFWTKRDAQLNAQRESGTQDQGSRGSVTGGGHIQGFIDLVSAILEEQGLHHAEIITKRSKAVLPGFFRATKEWDLLVVRDGHLLASLECKSQVGSFGNNFNNRTEEALGSATDLWTAYREGAYAPSPSPWLGYLLIFEDSTKSSKPVKSREPQFSVFQEFRDASYAKRYEILCLKLIRERLYNAACLITTPRDGGRRGGYREPHSELRFETFIRSLITHVRPLAV